MITFVDYYNDLISLKKESIDGGYVTQQENSRSWYAHFYIHGRKYSYLVSDSTARSIKDFFRLQAEEQL